MKEIILDISEGFAKIKGFKGKISRKDKVFYNPKMRINRDLSVIILKIVRKNAEILDGFAATGIRGIRYLLEADAKKVVFSDINPNAIELIKENLKNNNVLEKAEIVKKDCRIVMLENPNKFDVIDIDPFGSPAIFIDAAAASLKNKGLCFITATDLSALTGSNRKAGKRKYFIDVHRCDIMHDIAIRGLVSFIAREFAKHGKGIKVKLAYYKMHHIRIFLECERGKKKADTCLEKIGSYGFCQNCGYRAYFWDNSTNNPSKCPICKSPMVFSKNLWIDKYLDSEILKKMIKKSEQYDIYSETVEFLEIIKKESEIMEKKDVFTYDIHFIAKTWKIKEMKDVQKIIYDLRSSGFFAAKSHIKPTTIITNADVKNLAKIIKKK